MCLSNPVQFLGGSLNLLTSPLWCVAADQYLEKCTDLPINSPISKEHPTDPVDPLLQDSTVVEEKGREKISETLPFTIKCKWQTEAEVGRVWRRSWPAVLHYLRTDRITHSSGTTRAHTYTDIAGDVESPITLPYPGRFWSRVRPVGRQRGNESEPEISEFGHLGFL